MIGVVVPRRIAAITIAKWVGKQLGCQNGQIGYNVRFSSTVQPHTQIVFMTDGVMVQQLYSDPLLSKYSVIMLDDIHERSINFDILLGFLQKITSKRKDLKVVITSATQQPQLLAKLYQQLKVKSLRVAGRHHLISISYLKQPTSNYFLKMFQTLIFIDRDKPQGDVLCFLPSVEEIHALKNMLIEYIQANKRSLRIFELYAALSLQDQQNIFDPIRQRKIIIATNIAESSITIPKIRYVIDSGYTKIKFYDQKLGIERMVIVPCGKSNANQRAGRTGRTETGQCFRLYTKDAFQKMSYNSSPQLLRIDLSEFILKIKGLGIHDLLGFKLLDKVEQSKLAAGLNILHAYGLIDSDGNLTQRGLQVSLLPLDICDATMLLNSLQPRFGCGKQIIMLVSMLQIQRDLFTTEGISVLKSKKKVGSKEGDFLTLINYYTRYSLSKPSDRKKVCSDLKLRHTTMQKAMSIHNDLLKIIQQLHKSGKVDKDEQNAQKYQLKSSVDQHQCILRCILTGYFTKVAQLQSDGTYIGVRSHEKLQMHPTSVLSVVYPQWIIYHQIVFTHSLFIHNGSKIQIQWLFQLAGHYWKDHRQQIANREYQQEKKRQRPDYMPPLQNATDLIQVGAKVQKQNIFKTSVLGLKNTKKSKLSIGDEDF